MAGEKENSLRFLSSGVKEKKSAGRGSGGRSHAPAAKGEGPGPEVPMMGPEVPAWFWEKFVRFVKANPPSATFPLDPPDSISQEEKIHPEISLVVPVYNEAENLNLLYARLTDVLQGTGFSYEIIFVDDGSSDGGLDRLSTLGSQDPHFMIIELSRNFGHQTAISAGLDYARGQGVMVMDADLQDPPEVLPQFIAKWKEGFDVVYAVRRARKEGLGKRTAYALYYRLLKRIANIDIPLDAGDFCIMDRKVVDLIKAMPERNRFVRGIRSWVGLRQTGLPYERKERHAGRPAYTFGRLLYLALDGMVSFSYVPLRLISLVGIGVSIVSLIMALFYVVKKLVFGLTPPGFATLTAAVFFLAGIQLITIGVIGEYVGRIFEEVKRRPLYVVRRIIQGKPNAHFDAQQ